MIYLSLLAPGNPVYEIILLPEFYTGGGDCPPLQFVVRASQDEELLLNINISLPEFIGTEDVNNPQFVYASDAYQFQVTDVIREALLDHPSVSESEGSPIRMHQLLNENFQVGFILEFHNIVRNVAMQVANPQYAPDSDDPVKAAEPEFITIFTPVPTDDYVSSVDIFEERPIHGEHDLTIDDRPVMNDGSVNNSIDRFGEKLDDQTTAEGDGDVFSFDFEDILDELDDYVFFFKSTKDFETFGAHLTYADWPSTVTGVYSGDTGGDTTEVSGGTRSTSDESDAPSEASEMDGDRRVGTDFTNEVLIDQPLYADDIRALFDEPHDTYEFALKVKPQDVVDEFNLIAYKIPKASNGNADYSRSGGALPGSDEAGAITFTMTQAEFDKDIDDWVANTVSSSVIALLHYNGDDADAQKVAYKNSIVNAFTETDEFNAVLSGEKITVTSKDNIAYVVNMSLEGGEIKPPEGADEDPDYIPTYISIEDLLPNPIEDQGYYDVVNGTPTGNQRALIPPCIRVLHNDSDIPFFTFDTGLIRLIGEGDGDLANTDWMQLIADGIDAVVPGQWSYDNVNFIWTSKAVTYDESMGDTGVPYPNENGTYNFPNFRSHNGFILSSFSSGNNLANRTFMEPTSSLNQQGSYRNITLGTHYAMRLSNNISYLFYIGDQTISTVGDYLKSEIERRIPEMQVVSSPNGATIEPAVIGENSIFILESYLNLEDSLEDFRRLIDHAQYTQDPENPQVQLTLPDSVLEPTSADFPSAIGPSLNQVITTNFDLVRTWSETQVNFSVEFPIFAAGRAFHDGNTVNKVLAGDIGYSIPIFSQTTTGTKSYSSFVERKQMGMTPEFTTESVQSLALWTDGGSPAEFLGDLRYNILQLNMSVTNNPGQVIDLNNPQYINTHYISEDYKMDTRLTGRFLNWKLSDEVDEVSTNPGGKTFSQQTDWRVSGMQWKIRPAGRR